MSLKSLLFGIGEIKVGDQNVVGNFSKIDSVTPHVFTVDYDGMPVRGFGASQDEARENALQFLLLRNEQQNNNGQV